MVSSTCSWNCVVRKACCLSRSLYVLCALQGVTRGPPEAPATCLLSSPSWRAPHRWWNPKSRKSFGSWTPPLVLGILKLVSGSALNFSLTSSFPPTLLTHSTSHTICSSFPFLPKHFFIALQEMLSPAQRFSIYLLLPPPVGTKKMAKDEILNLWLQFLLLLLICCL